MLWCFLTPLLVAAEMVDGLALLSFYSARPFIGRRSSRRWYLSGKFACPEVGLHGLDFRIVALDSEQRWKKVSQFLTAM